MKPVSKKPTKYPGISKLVWPSGEVTYRATAPWFVDSAGKRHNPSKNCPTLAAARDWRTDQLSDRQKGVKHPTGRLTLGEYLDGWIEKYETRSPGNTAGTYRRALAKLRALPIWKMRLADVEHEDVAEAYDALPPLAVSHVHDALHRGLRDATPRWIGRNPASGAERGRRTDRAERAVWTEYEYRAWLATAADDELWPLWRTLGQSGARRGELLGLDWPDVDLEHARLSIRRQFTVVNGKHVLKDVKMGKPGKPSRARRTIDLDGETVAILRVWRKQQPTRRLGRDAHAVFTYPDGSRVGPSRALNDRFQVIVKAAKVRRLTIHDVRHTHATLLLRRGVPIHVVSRRLGHENEAITLTIYSHVLPDQARMAADAAGSIGASAEDQEVAVRDE